MKQKIVHLHSKVNEKGVLVELDLDEEYLFKLWM